MRMKVFLITLVFLTLIILICNQFFKSWSLQHRNDRLHSERQFYRIAATQACLNLEAVIHAAEAQGFHYVEFGEDLEQQIISPVPYGTIRSVEVHIKPNPFLAPATGAMFHFGQDGCWISGE